MNSGIFDLAIIVGLAAFLGIIGRLLKQPLILTYIVTGLLIGVSGYFNVSNNEMFQTFSDMGIMFLLFLIGLEINYDSLRLVGKISIVIGLLEIAATFILGYLLALVFGFSSLEASYISIALTFSSTIIVVKLLSEKKDLNSLYGKITVGFLLVQDFIAILLLIALGGLDKRGTVSVEELFFAIIKGIIIFSLVLVFGRRLLPAIFDKIAASKELLFLTSLAWCFAVAVAAVKSGLSIEIGGFLAGVALANSSEHYEISARVRSLRDFFILIFFVILGLSLTSFNLHGLSLPIVVFSLFVLIANPVIVLLIMGLWGYRKRTAFLCGITTAQISEFSFILAAMGLKLGHLRPEAVSLITAVGIITIGASSYLIIYNEEIFRVLRNYLKIFERRRTKGEVINGIGNITKPIILIGSHRLGQNILPYLPKRDVLVIDFDPNVITDLRRQGYFTLFGDISDAEIMERADLPKARLIISTSPDFEDNSRLLAAVKEFKKPPHLILRAENEQDAEYLYGKGASYVILPHLTSGQFIGKIIGNHTDLNILGDLRKKDKKILKKVGA